VTARVLIVDDILTNVRLLEARLSAEYFEVVTASSGAEALAICAREIIDIVLLDVMMPGMDGYEVCTRLKADPNTSHIPVVMVTALDQPSYRLRGLEAGADDFLTKPVDDVQLMARVKSLVRLKALTDELRARAAAAGEASAGSVAMEAIVDTDGRILVIDSDIRAADRINGFLGAQHKVELLINPDNAAQVASEGDYELVLISMALEAHDPLRIASQMRSADPTRTLPLILIADEGDRARVVRGLEIGINDFITRPIERNELRARVRTQIRRFRYAKELRRSLTDTMALAVTDQLTGLYNRRYFERHLAAMLGRARDQAREMAMMIIDLDHFKQVNDSRGHVFGDQVLKEFADRLRRNIRGVDLPCRLGGEEFVVLMPDTDLGQAQGVAERVRCAVAERPFYAGESQPQQITVSVGIAINEQATDSPDDLLKRADIALYRAKREGRNRVVHDAA
jgi:two-component system cell cycle response regulator